jgi:peptidylamidoglycolate lyase
MRLGILIASLIVVFASAAEDAAPYEVVHGWPDFDAPVQLGQIPGIEVAPNGDVWLFTRADRVMTTDGPIGSFFFFSPFAKTKEDEPIANDTVFCIDARTGKVKQQWGKNRILMSHGLTVDPDGNVWITDIGRHQVIKCAPNGNVLLTIGEDGVPGVDKSHFDKPTDVAIAPNGDIFVADGYGNSRIVKYDKDGNYLMEWGRLGDKPGEFDTPHGLALDPKRERLYVADRTNNRIQIFDFEGAWIESWQSEALGRPWGLDVDEDGNVFSIDGGDVSMASTPRGAVVKLSPDGEVLAKWSEHGPYNGQLIWGHDIAVDKGGNVYTCEVHFGMRAQKFAPAK